MNGVKGLGILAVVMLAAGLAYIPWRWPRSRHHTFSQHVAAHKQATLYYVILFAAVLPLLIWFFASWFVPVFKLSAWFNVFIIASSVTQLACTLVPETGGRKTRYHQSLAAASAICLLPPMVLLLNTDTISSTGQIMATLGLTVMLVLAGVVIAHRGKPKNFLIIQIGYFAAFFGPILAISYLL
jgi:magnesium-transporting ATPase (P-type)